jgi:hypothetical protein
MGSDTRHKGLRIRRNETTIGLFQTGSLHRPTPGICRSRSVEPGTATEDNKHETSLDWRRHGRGPRDRRPGLGTECAVPRADDAAGRRAEGSRRPADLDSDGDEADGQEADGYEEADDASRRDASQGYDELGRPDDGRTQQARAAKSLGRRHAGPGSGDERSPTAAGRGISGADWTAPGPAAGKVNRSLSCLIQAQGSFGSLVAFQHSANRLPIFK